MVNCLMVQILRKTETGKKWSSFSKFCTAGHRLVGGWPVDPARKKVRKSSQLFRRLNQAQEQQRSVQTGRDGKRCAALLGLTRRGRHPAGRGQLPGSTTGKATTEALAVDAICLPSDMLQDRIWGLSCKAAFLVEGQVEQVGSAYLGG